MFVLSNDDMPFAVSPSLSQAIENARRKQAAMLAVSVERVYVTSDSNVVVLTWGEGRLILKIKEHANAL